jgi:D-threo-aldose 1-dehydrogenase
VSGQLNAVARHAEIVRLGPGGVPVTRMGLGSSPLGGLFGAVAASTATAVARAALDAGLRYVDTAPLYGRGLAERRLGAALGSVQRDSFVLSTKVGRLVRPVGAAGAEPPDPRLWPEAEGTVTILDYGYDGVRRSLEESLARLRLEAVDIVYVHDPDDHLDEAMTVTAAALERLREEGLIRAFGFGMNAVAPLTRAVRETSLDCVLVAGRLTLLDGSAAADLLPLCLERGVGVVVGGVLNSGILARPGARDVTYDYAPAPPHVANRAVCLAEVCRRHGVPLAAAALQFPLRHRAVDCVLVGVRSVEELQEAVAAFDLELPDDLWHDLAVEGLMPRGMEHA